MSVTTEDRVRLASSAEFQQFLADDPEMQNLEASEIDYGVEKELLWETLGGTYKICGVEVSPITPAIWCFLWLTRNALCTGKPPVMQDVANALYLLSHSLNGFHFDSFEENAREFAESNNLSKDDLVTAWEEMVEMVERMNSPLKMLPSTKCASKTEEPVFDTDWFLSVCSIAASEANVSLDEIASHYPLSAVYGLLVIRARKANPDSCISRHTPEFVGKRMLERTDELVEEFLNREKKAS